jgi:ArsR family metal-binding transcriptional regulator
MSESVRFPINRGSQPNRRPTREYRPLQGVEMLIESYKLEVEVSPHSADEFEYEAIALLAVDIGPALPYLNATLRNGMYFTDGPVFSWRKDEHKIGFWPDRIAVDHLESRERAEEMAAEMVKLVNDVWERRGEIEPDTTPRENLQPVELYRLLPRTHCKACGESTCFTFALKLAAGQVELGECGPICSEEEYKERREQLELLIATKRPLL